MGSNNRFIRSEQQHWWFGISEHIFLYEFQSDGSIWNKLENTTNVAVYLVYLAQEETWCECIRGLCEWIAECINRTLKIQTSTQIPNSKLYAHWAMEKGKETMEKHTNVLACIFSGKPNYFILRSISDNFNSGNCTDSQNSERSQRCSQPNSIVKMCIEKISEFAVCTCFSFVAHRSAIRGVACEFDVVRSVQQ